MLSIYKKKNRKNKKRESIKNLSKVIKKRFICKSSGKIFQLFENKHNKYISIKILTYIVTKKVVELTGDVPNTPNKSLSIMELLGWLWFKHLRGSKYHIINYGVNYHRDLDALTPYLSILEVPLVLSQEEMIALSALAILGVLLKISRIHYR